MAVAVRILVEITVIIQTCRHYRRERDRLLTLLQALKNLVDRLGVVWSGAAYDAFRLRFYEFYTNLVTTLLRMDDAETELEKAGNFYQQAEDTVNSLVQGLDIGTPFSG